MNQHLHYNNGSELGLCGIAVFFQSVNFATSQHHRLTNFLADTSYLFWQLEDHFFHDRELKGLHKQSEHFVCMVM